MNLSKFLSFFYKNGKEGLAILKSLKENKPAFVTSHSVYARLYIFTVNEVEYSISKWDATIETTYYTLRKKSTNCRGSMSIPIMVKKSIFQIFES